MVGFVAVARAAVFVWATLNAIDDVALLMRVGRLAAVAIPKSINSSNGDAIGGDTELCEVCDDVMGDLLKGSEGLSAIPCGAACLGLKQCVQMCESLKKASATSTQFPCVAAGYCDAVQADMMESDDPECTTGPFFSCRPRRYCRRKRKGIRMTCDLRPGIGRWLGLKHAASHHMVALAESLLSQPHCGDAGINSSDVPYCIAKPRGLGAMAEVAGNFISLVIGGYSSIKAIESPGGNDDQQWLTFWLILTVTLFCEKFFARVILSSIPFYYECKLAVIIWLMCMSGAEIVYRKLRRSLTYFGALQSEEQANVQQLEIFKATGKDVVRKLQLTSKQESQKLSAKKLSSPASTKEDWEYDDSVEELPDAGEQLFQLSRYIISAEGATALERSKEVSIQDMALLVERAAEVVSFQPRYLRVHLHGVVETPEGDLPSMDRNGLADPYVVCRLIPQDGKPYPEKGVSSRVAYKTLRPTWEEEIELSLRGGSIDVDGYYKSHEQASTTLLHLQVRDADTAHWGIAHFLFRAMIFGSVIAAVAAHVHGVTDALTNFQWNSVMFTILLIGIGLVATYEMAITRRSDDQDIGECIVPLALLLDQREHNLKLILRAPKGEESGDDAEIDEEKKNSVGGFGIIRATLELSEH